MLASKVGLKIQRDRSKLVPRRALRYASAA
jgi:hypothetical protein